MANKKQLSFGSSGEDVKNLQLRLNEIGNYNLQTDGIYGSNTQAAVKDYQQKNGLATDGIVGTQTWSSLETKPATKSANATQGTTSTTSTGTAPTGYQPSDTVAQAQQMLNDYMAQKPGAYQSTWQGQMDELMNQILNRKPFEYDVNSDALYQQYKDQYVLQGQQAMLDTMGQAAALTGGYGNSYAQTAGQQAYQGYLQQLNDRIPDLYQLALSKYQMEGNALADQYAMLGAREDQAYGRYRDSVSDYYNELQRLYSQYNTEREYDYGQFIDDRNYQYQQDRDAVADQQWQAQYDEAIRQWQAEFDEAQRQYNESQKQKSTGSPVYTPKEDPTPTPGKETETVDLATAKLSDAAQNVWNNIRPPYAGSNIDSWYKMMDERIEELRASGKITDQDALILLYRLGLDKF